MYLTLHLANKKNEKFGVILKFAKGFSVWLLPWSFSDAVRDGRGPIIFINAHTETCLPHILSDQQNKRYKSKNIPVSFLQKANRFQNRQGRELEEENWQFFLCIIFLTKQKDFDIIFMTNCTHIFEIFVNLASIMYIFQSFSLKFLSIYLVGKVKSNFCLLTLPFPLLPEKNGNAERRRLFLSSAGEAPVCSSACIVYHHYFSTFSFHL